MTPIQTPNIFAPVSTPALAIRALSFIVLAITGAIFLIVAGLAVYTLIRFGPRPPHPELGPAQVYGSTQTELARTVVPLLILVPLRPATARSVCRPVRRVLRAPARVDAPRRGRSSQRGVPGMGHGATDRAGGAGGGEGGPRSVLFVGLRQLPQHPRDAGKRRVRPGPDASDEPLDARRGCRAQHAGQPPRLGEGPGRVQGRGPHAGDEARRRPARPVARVSRDLALTPWPRRSCPLRFPHHSTSSRHRAPPVSRQHCMIGSSPWTTSASASCTS